MARGFLRTLSSLHVNLRLWLGLLAIKVGVYLLTSVPQDQIVLAEQTASAEQIASAERAARGCAYVVWRVPGRADLTGVHTGGTRAWAFLEPKLGGVYSYAAGHRLRRVNSLDVGVELYRSEARVHGVSMHPTVHAH